MATLFMDDFGYQPADRDLITASGVKNNIATNYKYNDRPFNLPTTQQSFLSGGTARDQWNFYLPDEPTEIYVGFWILPSDIYSTTYLQAHFFEFTHPWRGTANAHVNLYHDVWGRIRVYNDAVTLIAGPTAVNVLKSYTWQFIECHLKVDSSTGSVEVRVNGNSVLNETNVNTKNSGAPDNKIGHVAFPDNTIDRFLIHTIYINDTTGGSPNNTFWGPTRYETLRPDGAGFQTDFTPSAGSNYQNVDEVNTDTTTYNESATATHIDSFTYGNMSWTPDTIFNMGVVTIAKKEDVPGVKKMRSRVRSSASDDLGDTTLLSGGRGQYNNLRQLVPLNPNGSVAWTKTTVDAAQAGYEVIT